MKQKTLALILGTGIMIAVGIFVFSLMSSTNKETEISITNGMITFSGQYGASYSLSDLVEVTKPDSMPPVTYKSNGASIGEIKKGDFTVEGLGKCRLYIHTAAGPFLILKFKAATVIVNFKDAQKTESLYQSLL